MVRLRPSTPAERAMYDEVTRAVQAIVARYPSVRALEVVALLGHATGVAIGLSAYADERDLARLTAIENIDEAIARIDRARGGVPPPHPASTGRPA